MTHQTVPADEALQRIREGNEHFTSGKMINQIADPQTMRKLAIEGQDPWVVVLTCMDSRVVLPWVFDFKMGDSFLLRTIGGMADISELAGVWYAVKANNIRLLVVLGHESCGAVQHAMKGERCGEVIDAVVDYIEPAAEAMKDQEGDNVKNVVVENARRISSMFSEHPDFKALVDSGDLRIVPAYYHLATGQVDFIEE